jgi:NAD(P)H-dependent FMN reductase
MSKILILSAGTSKDSYNSQLARHLSDHMSGNNQGNYIYENLFEGIPFLLDTNDSVPDKIANMRKSLEESSKLIIFSPVYNGGYLAHLKNTLDWLSLAYEDRKYNSLFKDKNVAVVTTVKGVGGNAEKAFEILSMQLSNYGLFVFKNFHLITKSDHLNLDDITKNKKILESLYEFIDKFSNE